MSTTSEALLGVELVPSTPVAKDRATAVADAMPAIANTTAATRRRTMRRDFAATVAVSTTVVVLTTVAVLTTVLASSVGVLAAPRDPPWPVASLYDGGASVSIGLGGYGCQARCQACVSQGGRPRRNCES